MAPAACGRQSYWPGVMMEWMSTRGSNESSTLRFRANPYMKMYRIAKRTFPTPPPLICTCIEITLSNSGSWSLSQLAQSLLQVRLQTSSIPTIVYNRRRMPHHVSRVSTYLQTCKKGTILVLDGLDRTWSQTHGCCSTNLRVFPEPLCIRCASEITVPFCPLYLCVVWTSSFWWCKVVGLANATAETLWV